MAARYRFCREYVDKETPSMSVDIPTFMLGVFIYEALSLQQTAICELPDTYLRKCTSLKADTLLNQFMKL